MDVFYLLTNSKYIRLGTTAVAEFLEQASGFKSDERCLSISRIGFCNHIWQTMKAYYGDPCSGAYLLTVSISAS
jgi:hypothetical protein